MTSGASSCNTRKLKVKINGKGGRKEMEIWLKKPKRGFVFNDDDGLKSASSFSGNQRNHTVEGKGTVPV